MQVAFSGFEYKLTEHLLFLLLCTVCVYLFVGMCVSLPLCFSLAVCPSLCVTLSLPVSLYPSVCLSQSLSVHSLSLSVSLCAVCMYSHLQLNWWTVWQGTCDKPPVHTGGCLADPLHRCWNETVFPLRPTGKDQVESPKDEDEPGHLAEVVFRDLVCRASYGHIRSVLVPVLVWVKRVCCEGFGG